MVACGGVRGAARSLAPAMPGGPGGPPGPSVYFLERDLYTGSGRTKPKALSPSSAACLQASWKLSRSNNASTGWPRHHMSVVSSACSTSSAARSSL